MIFIRKDKYYEESKEGYRVSAFGGRDGFKFGAFDPDKELIGFCDDSESARELCRRHFLDKQNDNL